MPSLYHLSSFLHKLSLEVALVNEFYSDINKWNYPAAFSLLSGGKYCNFVDGYAHTLHDDTSIGNISKNPNGTFKVELSVKASEKLPWETATTTYQGYETVGQVKGTWKILGGSLPETNRVATPEPPPATPLDAAPSQQAQALIQQFHNDISNRNYPAAYNSWGNAFQSTTDYCKFVGSYTNTLHDDVLIEQVTTLPNATQVVTIVNTTEETPSGNTQRSYQETYTVGQENGTWKILQGKPS